jgi:hypothetical protein
MTTSLLQNTAPKLLGEIIAWQFPLTWSATHADLVAALTAAGLDPKWARDLAGRFAFIRACRALRGKPGVRDFVEDEWQLTFQYDYEAAVHLGGVTVQKVTGTVSMDKTTGFVTCQDKQIEAQVVALVSKHLKARTLDDVTRLLHSLFKTNADIFPIKLKAGVFFCPIMHQTFLDQIERFVVALRGSMTRFPVPDGTAQGAVSVEKVVTDGLLDAINEYEDALAACRDKPKEDATLKRAQEAVAYAAEKCRRYSNFVGAHLVMLEDHAAHVARLIQDRREQLAKAAVPAA